ncbi:MAG: hypothetical protein JKY55_08400 [Aliivibrio sp.]|uniref:hypothetical protein n=1 Tax=Aliivibrio sp. TaxID=1872443 RepID=UPI001A61115A|nr:hypothetical protein [Aliivibrio sp.]
MDICKALSTLFFTILSLTSFQAASQVGGKCDYVDVTEFAQVTNVHSTVSLLSASGKTIDVELNDFSTLPERKTYFELTIRRHTSGGCSPFSVIAIKPLVKPNVQLNINAGQAYQGAFILAEAKSCSIEDRAGCSGIRVVSEFDYRNSPLLSSIDVRSIRSCSAAILQTLWAEVVSESVSKVIACVDTQTQQEILVEFTREVISADNDKLRLLTLH